MRSRCTIPLLLLALALAACVRLTVPAPEVREYRLDYPVPEIEGRSLPVVVRLEPFAAAAAYDREAIVYRENDYEAGIYFYHQWLATPASMVADLLARDLAASGLYAAVEQGVSSVSVDYDIAGVVEQIEEHVRNETCSAALRLRILLTRVAGPRRPAVVFQKIYSAEEPCHGEQPVDFVEAMSRAMQRVATGLQRDIHAAIAEDRGGGRRLEQ